MATLPLNSVVGKYRIDCLVGSGGMGEVYRATNLATRTPVAIKLLTRQTDQATAGARFRNEAAIQSNLRHPNVAELYDYFSYQGTPCIAMEYVDGRTLRDWIAEAGAFEPAKALEVMAEICDAVSYMHAKGTIHRDIKSENIRIDAHGRVKLLDFGIAVDPYTPQFTRAGCAIGTPEKMAPEQHRGLRGDARSDVWALGVLLYEMVTGALPFSNSSEAALRDDIQAVRYVIAQKRRPGLPAPVAQIIATCLRLRPDDRYQSSGELLRAVQQARQWLGAGRFSGLTDINPLYLAGGLLLIVVAFFIYVLGRNVTQPNPFEPVSQTSGTEDTVSHGESKAQQSQNPPVRTDEHQLREDTTPAVRSEIQAVNPPNIDPNAPAADQATVVVDTNDGSAEVTDRDGKVLGRTPYNLAGPVGRTFELWLRRPGYQTKKVDVTISPTRHNFTYGLDKNY